jgi:hypothetical protein
MKNNSVKKSISIGLTWAVLGMFAAQAERLVQGLVGATQIDEDEIVFSNIPELDEAVAEGADLSTLFTVGASAMEILGESDRALQTGVEVGFTFSFGGDDRDVAGGGGSGVVVVNVDSSLLLSDVFAGVFLRKETGNGTSLYVGAGPLLMFARITGDFVERDVEDRSGLSLDESETAFGVGGYVRAGLEFPWKTGGTFGIGVRAFTASVDFDHTLGDVDFQGVQGFVGYTQGF